MDFFCILYNILKNSLVDIFMRCLSYRLIKIHRKFTSAYRLCDKVSLIVGYNAEGSTHLHVKKQLAVSIYQKEVKS